MSRMRFPLGSVPRGPLLRSLLISLGLDDAVAHMDDGFIPEAAALVYDAGSCRRKSGAPWEGSS